MKNESGKEKSNYKTLANYFSNFIKQLLFLFLKREIENSIMNYLPVSFAFFVFSFVTIRKRVQMWDLSFLVQCVTTPHRPHRPHTQTRHTHKRHTQTRHRQKKRWRVQS